MDDNGQILFAECAERFLQYKRALGCPPDLDFYIEKIINQYITWHVDELVVSYSWTEWSHIKAKVYSVYNHFKNVNSSIYPNLELATNRYISALNQAGAGFIRAFKIKYKGIKITKRYFNHHLCHIYNSIYLSNINDGIGLVLDGKGDDSSYSVYEIHDAKIKNSYKIKNLQSLGYLYALYTELCGYSHLKGEEWKVMGLSPYGRENEELEKIIDEGIKKSHRLRSNTSNIIREIIEKINQKLIKFEDVAYLAQKSFESIFFSLIDRLKKNEMNSQTLFLSGGSALNTLAVGKLHEKGLYENIIVPNAPADDGNAIGAAILGYLTNTNFKQIIKDKNYRSPFLGSEITKDELARYVSSSLLPFIKTENPSRYAAELLNDNKIIGWIQGRAEFGPRALGNRSILAHPGFAENKDRINAVVKFRESYRPFAPSILHEFGNDYFEKYSFTPYMEKTLTFKESVRGNIPAVVHVNGTGRLQSVTKEINEKYYNLISEFYKLSGLPLVVNTSYNVMGKPIVHDINDVMAVFFNSSIDAVIIGDYVIERKDLKR
jgi:carbamoyltransferase